MRLPSAQLSGSNRNRGKLRLRASHGPGDQLLTSRFWPDSSDSENLGVTARSAAANGSFGGRSRGQRFVR
jgi:hypothetical protein